MENRKNIDDHFKSELGNYTETPPPAVWDALEKKLDHAPSQKPVSPFARFGFFAALCVLITVSVLVAINTNSNKQTAINNAAGQNIPATNNTTDNTTPIKEQATAATNNNEPNHIDEDGNIIAADNTEAQNMDNPANRSTEASTTPVANKQDNNPAASNTAHKNKQAHSDINNERNKTHTNALAGNIHKQAAGYSSNVNRSRKQNKQTEELTNNYNSSKPSKNTSNRTERNRIVPENDSKPRKYPGYSNTTTGSRKQDEETEQPTNNYNSSEPANTTNTTATTNNTTATNDVVHNDADDTRKENDKPIPPPPPADQKKPAKPRFYRFEAGIKGGYEQSGTNDAAKSALVSPYVQYKVTRRLAVMLQPAIKYATVSSRQIGNDNAYYKLNPDGAITQQSDQNPVKVVGSDSEYFWIWHYTYTETHDSIIKSNHTGGKYLELELPVLLKYYVAKDFSIYGGLNITYSKLMGLTERTYTEKGLSRTASATGWGPINSPAPPPPSTLSTELTYTGTPFSSYMGPQYPVPAGSIFRFGYMAGFTYEYDKRWLFDLLLQQTFIKPNVQGGYNTNTPLSAPYLRLTIGYKLTK